MVAFGDLIRSISLPLSCCMLFHAATPDRMERGLPFPGRVKCGRTSKETSPVEFLRGASSIVQVAFEFCASF
ncbi:hypothetical protein CPAR01_04816 [Colletotrichum paranaense]|uniref:Uncharacterized protein n=2 Tax=Colletotrichum acutatum species complex TaxID=2707335 RepID=A0AAI9XHB6_9PEZI|nr:uncharacterized protein CPAR01_04816 [Colletotrichum paranaense]KAK1447599.1 hypothetical protein CMEL01_09438 [Colletotrichum melonis]KAK1544183.1 hypothetical protein CPAR01_04816 [Colletotrichum paranaense]